MHVSAGDATRLGFILGNNCPSPSSVSFLEQIPPLDPDDINRWTCVGGFIVVHCVLKVYEPLMSVLRESQCPTVCFGATVGQLAVRDHSCNNFLLLALECDQPSVEQSGGTLIPLTLTRLARFLQTFPRQSLNVSGTVSCGL